MLPFLFGICQPCKYFFFDYTEALKFDYLKHFKEASDLLLVIHLTHVIDT